MITHQVKRELTSPTPGERDVGLNIHRSRLDIDRCGCIIGRIGVDWGRNHRCSIHWSRGHDVSGARSEVKAQAKKAAALVFAAMMAARTRFRNESAEDKGT